MGNKNRRQLVSVGRFFNEDIHEKLIKTNHIWYWVFFILAAFVILSLSVIGTAVSYEEGDVASESLIYEGATFSYTSDVAYNKAVQEIEADVNDVYTLDNSKTEAITAGMNDFVEKMKLIKAEKDADSDYVVSIYKELFGDGDDAAVYEAALNSLQLKDITAVTSILEGYFAESYDKGIKEAELERFKTEFSKKIEKNRNWDKNRKTAAEAIISILPIEANYVLNEEETNAVTESRISEIQPENVTIRSGQKIVDEGTVITAEQMEALQKAGMLTGNKGVFYFLGIFGLVFAVFFMIFLYCKRFFPFYAFEKEGILLVGLVIVVFLAVSQVIMLLTSSTGGTLHSIIGFLLPLPAVALIFTTLTNQRLAFVLTLFSGILMLVLLTSQPTYYFVALLASLFTIYVVGRIRERYQVVSFGFYLGLVYILLILIFGCLGEQSPKTVFSGCFVGFLSGFLCSFLALGSLPLLENILKISTPMKLMELSSTGHPLIKRLMAEAPGTYYHSVLLGNLAEVAADAIGADALLARVASYYHDIGKLERPAYFTENQEDGVNPHDKLTPSLSTLILVSHVKDGIEMAKEYGLPQEVIDIIEQHHGDSLIRYFYHKAKEADPEISQEDFCYPFRKPQTRESAIVMMADCVQAALQSMPPMSRGETTAKIHELIDIKLQEGQFKECDLTFRDLHVIQEAFVSVYDGLKHNRVRYPELKALAKKSGIKIEIPDPAKEYPAEENDTKQ